MPEHWAEDPPLGNLVHKQRTLKKQLDRGKPGVGMTVEWVARLTSLGFVWEQKSFSDISRLPAPSLPPPPPPTGSQASTPSAVDNRVSTAVYTTAV